MIGCVLRVCLSLLILTTLGVAYQNQSCTGVTGHESEILSNISSGINANSNKVVLHDGFCRLASDCCSGRAEALIGTAVTVKYQTGIRSLLNNASTRCYNSTVYDLLYNFIGGNKNLLVTDLRVMYGVPFLPYLTLFDTFYSYLQQAIYTRDICQLREQFNQVFFNLYMATYRAFATSTIPADTTQFRNCSYTYFMQTQGITIQSFYTIFSRPFEMLMQYLRALKTANEVLEFLQQEPTFSQGCNASLAKMVACPYCAGYGGVTPLCQGMCLNAFRGCLVDFAGLVAPFREFTNTLVTFSRILRTDYNPWDQVTLLENKFLTQINTVSQQWSTINRGLTAVCNTGGTTSNSKRSPFHPVAEPTLHLITRRATTSITATTLKNAVNGSGQCFLSLPSLMETLPEVMCSSLQTVPTNEDCWNGLTLGSYQKNISQPGVPSQFSNPEVPMCQWSGMRYNSQIQLLNTVTNYMKVKLGLCSPDDEDCVIPTTTCQLQYAIPRVSVATTTPQEFVADDSGSGGGSGDYSEECTMNTPVLTPTPMPTPLTPTLTDEPCTGVEIETAGTTLTVPKLIALLPALLVTALFSTVV